MRLRRPPPFPPSSATATANNLRPKFSTASEEEEEERKLAWGSAELGWEGYSPTLRPVRRGAWLNHFCRRNRRKGKRGGAFLAPRFAGLPGHRLEQIVFVRYIFRSELFGHFFGAAPRLTRPLPLFPFFYTRA